MQLHVTLLLAIMCAISAWNVRGVLMSAAPGWHEPSSCIPVSYMRMFGTNHLLLLCVMQSPMVSPVCDFIEDDQHVEEAGQMQEQNMSAARPKLANKLVNGNLSAMLPKLIPAAKQQEYIAAFGSQTKLPRTPLLSGYK